MHAGIFIRPHGEVKKALLAEKALVESHSPGQKYCNHPPHSTIIAGWYVDIELWLDGLIERVNSFAAPLRLETEGYFVFYDDPEGGGHTVVHRLQRTTQLVSLQHHIATHLAAFRDHDSEPPLPRQYREPYKSSLRTYGFPFVGAHWIPHLTVASIRTDRDDPFLQELTSKSRALREEVQSLEIWQIDGDLHQTVASLPLGGQAIRKVDDRNGG